MQGSDKMSLISEQSKNLIAEVIEMSKLKENDILVIGCSSSEVGGDSMGTNSNYETACEIFNAVYPLIKEKRIFLAIQCCEHLNRAIIVEEECAKMYGCEIVNVKPQPKAGGSFATCGYENFKSPVAVEFIKADAGIDIGGVLIGMHIKHVAVPLKIQTRHIGKAHVTAARHRAKFIGGQRAFYNNDLM